MKILVVGPGAMGCLFAYLLSKGGNDVCILDKKAERAKIISENGIRVEGISGNHKVHVPVTTKIEELNQPDLVILAVKSYDTEKAIQSVIMGLKEECFVLSVQNGLGNIEAISQCVGVESTIGGTTSQGATMLGIGHIRHAGIGETVIGSFQIGMKSKIEEIKGIFDASQIPTDITDDVEGLLFSKVIINVGINPLTAILRLKNGMLLHYKETLDFLECLVNEAVAVAQSKKVQLIYDNPLGKVKEVAYKTGANISSMLQDVLNQKKTEISYINGAINRLGDELGVETPANKLVTFLVNTLEKSYTTRVERI
ncbi:MAG: 2-dehydropantoate 2-reductase [Thermodesulfobacteriota bacterium]|nr:2-dehydropantoate 2-reductase [Thermodesulfobacteriota bacterium]